MKKLLLLAVSMLLTSSLFAQYYIAGDGNATNNWCCGLSWKEAGCLLDGPGNSKSFSLQPGTFNFKVTDGTWANNWGFYNLSTASTSGTIDGGGGNVQFTLAVAATVTVSFDEDAKEITVTSTQPFGPLVISSWTLVGDEALVGVDWDPAATENDLAFVGGVYQITKTGVTLAADGLYQYKFAANHAWSIKEFPASGNEDLVVPTDGVYDIVFALNPATGEYGADAQLSTAADEAQANAAEVVGIYNMIGQPVSAQTPGLKIFVYSNGTTEKKY